MIFHPWIHSLSDYNSQCWTRLKPGVSSGFPSWVAGAQTRGSSSPALLSTPTGSQIRSKPGWVMYGRVDGNHAMSSASPPCCSTGWHSGRREKERCALSPLTHPVSVQPQGHRSSYFLVYTLYYFYFIMLNF